MTRYEIQGHARRFAIYRMVKGFADRTGRIPTNDEIVEATGLPLHAVNHYAGHVKRMVHAERIKLRGVKVPSAFSIMDGSFLFCLEAA